MEIVVMNGNEIRWMEYKGQPFVTMKMIIEVHGIDYNTGAQSFHRNKERLQRGVDYDTLTFREGQLVGLFAPAGCNIFYQSGYMKLVKTFGDDLAWEIQGKLIDCYFNHKKQIAQPTLPTTQTDPILAMLAILQTSRQDHLSLKSDHEKLSADVARLSDTVHINNRQQNALLNMVRHKVSLWKELRSDLNDKKAFQFLWRTLNNHFNVPRYDEIPFKSFDDALTKLRSIELRTFNTAQGVEIQLDIV